MAGGGPGLDSRGGAVEFAVGGEVGCQAAGARKAGKGPEPVHGTEGSSTCGSWRQAAATGADLTPEVELGAASSLVLGWVCGHAADRKGGGLSRLCRCSLLLSDQEHQVGPEAAEQASRPGFVARPVVHKLPAVRSPESAIKGRETYQAAVEHRRRDRFHYRHRPG